MSSVRKLSLDIKVSNGIGKSKKEAEPLRNITKQIDQCRSDLECLMHTQYSVQEGCNTDVFYGSHELPSDLRLSGIQDTV